MTDKAPATVTVKESDLPVVCPNPNMPVWCHHPRVFLDLSHGGAARCPYCGTEYVLADGVKLPAH